MTVVIAETEALLMAAFETGVVMVVASEIAIMMVTASQAAMMVVAKRLWWVGGGITGTDRFCSVMKQHQRQRC